MMDEKKTVALILAQLEPHEGLAITMQPDEEPELSPEEQLHAVAGELVEATRCGDVAAVAEALRAAFLLFDSQPHVEGEHVGEQEEEEEPEEAGHEYEPVSHEVRERLGGYREEEEEGHAYGGRAARKRYARGGVVRRYADGGMVESPTGRAVGGLQMPGAVTAGAMSPELSALTGRARMTMQQAGGMPASPGVVTSAPSTMISREALAAALAGRGRRPGYADGGFVGVPPYEGGDSSSVGTKLSRIEEIVDDLMTPSVMKKDRERAAKIRRTIDGIKRGLGAE